jgi:hypothetical protein
MEDKEQVIRWELSGDSLRIEKRFYGLMFDNIDSFVALSQKKTSVEIVVLYPFDSDAGNYEFWDKAGQIVGNLIELKTLQINARNEGGDEARTPDWEILTRILPYLRRKVELFFIKNGFEAELEEIQGLARVIHGHSMISEFRSQMDFTFANFIPWCSTLATLPHLERVALGLWEPETEDELVLVNLEPLTELLRAPALRFVEFKHFYFTDALCRATATALEEGSSIIDMTFQYDCTFPDGGGAIIANALKRNTSVTDVKFLSGCDEPFCNTLAAVLLCNATLQNLNIQAVTRASGRWLCSIFLSLGMNTTLKSLHVCTYGSLGNELGAATTRGLTKNTTLKKFSLDGMLPSGDDGTVSARNALSFLRTNTTLKTLTVSFQPVEDESYVSAFRLEAVKMIENNPRLESLTIKSRGSFMKVEELLALVSALQCNTTLKTLDISDMISYLTADEVKQLVPILMKNYGLEHLVPDICCLADDRAVKAIFRLNSVGRRYLIEDGSSISKGVDVLSAVSDDINCVFLHLLENPSLCDRRATDSMTINQWPGPNRDETSSCGKRERAQSHPVKEPRHRLA